MTTPFEDEARALIERFDWMRNSGVCSPTTRGLLDDAEAMIVAALASRVSTPPSEIAVTAEQIRSRLSHIRAYYDATWATREMASPSASELIWVLTGEEMWGEAYLDREYEPPVPAVPVLPTEPELIACPHWSPGQITMRKGCTACAASAPSDPKEEQK